MFGEGGGEGTIRAITIPGRRSALSDANAISVFGLVGSTFANPRPTARGGWRALHRARRADYPARSVEDHEHSAAWQVLTGNDQDPLEGRVLHHVDVNVSLSSHTASTGTR